MNKKKEILSEIFQDCDSKGDYEFNNDFVKKISTIHGFRNHNDVTKMDHSDLLPNDILQRGFCVVHLGGGNHKFINCAKDWYHQFEPILESEKEEWDYKPSLLNHTDNSESNIISMVYNQRLIHKFLYEDITADPKIYMSRRTKITAEYIAGDEIISAKSLQMEIDATFEYNREVTIIEGKNSFPSDFSVYQLFHPNLYYHQKVDNIAKINCCYILQKKHRNVGIIIRLYLYEFLDNEDIASIKLLRKKQYTFKPVNFDE